MAAMKLGRRQEQDRENEEVENEINEERERESLSGSRLSLQSQLSLSTMSEEYFNKGALDVLLVAVCSIMMLSAAFQDWYVHAGIFKFA